MKKLYLLYILLVITTCTQVQASAMLTNNNQYSSANTHFLDVNNQVVGNISIAPNSSGPIAANAVTAHITEGISDGQTETATDIYIAVSSSTSSSIFGNGIITAPLSTTFSNGSSQSIVIQARINNVNSGTPITIPYPGSGIVSVPATTGTVTYSITMPSQSYPAVIEPYNPTTYPGGYVIGAQPLPIGLVVTGITTPPSPVTPLTIQYFGTINSVPNSPLDAIPITVNPGLSIPIITGATSMTVYSGSTPVIANAPINANTNYGILQSNGTWSVSSNPTLTNNYNQATGTINFSPSGSIASLPAWGSVTIPSGTTNMTVYGLPGSGTYSIKPTGSNMNIYQNIGYYNNTPYSLLANCYTTSTTTSLNGNCTIAPGQGLPFVTGVNYMSITYNSATVISSQLITAGQSYEINYNSAGWQWKAANPSLQNNYNQPITNINFYNSNPNTSANFISSLSSIAGAIDSNNFSSASFPFNASYLTCMTTFYGGASSTLTTPTMLPWVYPFGNQAFAYGTMTNNTTNTVNVTYYGAINGIQTALNNPVISIPPQGNIPNITGSSTINVYNLDGTAFITQAPINTNTSYFINNNGSVQTTATSITLTNNSNIAGQIISFTTPQGITPATTLGAWSAVTIPTGATQASASYFINDGTLYALLLTPNTSINLFTNSIVTNNTTTKLILEYFPSSTSAILGNTFINPGQSIPIASTTGFIQLRNEAYSTIYATATIAANTSYLINSAGTGFSLTPYTPTLTNNYSQNSTNVNYYDSNNVFISSPGTITANSFAYTPANAYKVILGELLSTITLPTTFPYQNIFAESITNNSDQSIGIIYYGTVNNVNNVALNNPAISITKGQTSPILSAALNISVLDGSGNPVSSITNYQIQPGTPYYITYSGGVWYISSNPSSAQFLNNYNQQVTNVAFFNAANAQIGQTISTLPSNSSAPIPTGAVSCQFTTLYNGTFIESVSDSASSSIFGSGNITNNSDETVYVDFYGIVNGANTLLNYTPIELGANGASSLIPTGTSTINVSLSSGGSPVVTQSSASANGTYYINLTDITWSITPTATFSTLTNNNQYDSANTHFLDVNNLQVGNPISIAPNSSGPIAGTAVTAHVTEIISDGQTGTATDIYTPVSGSVNSNIFGTGTITNNASVILTIQYFGTLNSGLGTALNELAITINPGRYIPIITGATSMTVYSGSTIIIANTPINANTNYYISQSNGAWYVSLKYPLAQLINNSNNAATNVIFYNAAHTQVGQTILTLPNNGSASIPATAVSCTLTTTLYGTLTNITVEVSDSVDSYVCGLGALTNNADTQVSVNYTSSNSSIPLNSTPIVINPGQYIPIITGASTIYVLASGLPVYSLSSISADIFYFINHLSSGTQGSIVETWSITTAPIINNLTNNSNNSSAAMNIVFYDMINAIVGGYASIAAGASGPIAGTAVTALLTETINGGTTLTTPNIYVPVLGSASSNIFGTGGSITNNTTVPVTVTYFGPVSSALSPSLNTIPITIDPGFSIQIITGATSITVFHGSTTVILNAPINANSNYFINNSGTIWALDPFAASSILSNTSGYLVTDVIFYDENDVPIGTPLPSLAAGKSTAILTPAMKCTFFLLNATMTLAVSNTVNSNITELNIALYNNTDTNVTIDYYSTVNGAPGSLINSSPIAIGVGQSIPIITGTLAVSVYSPTSIPPVISPSSISTTASSYINLIGTTWSITPTADISYLTNNNSNPAATAKNVVFYDTNNVNVGNPTSIDQSEYAPIPGTAITASFQTTINDTDTDVWLPVYGGTSSNIFSTDMVTNNGPTSVTITYFAPLNPPFGPALNATPIAISHDQSSYIIKGATSITVYSNAIAVISNATIDINTNYFINFLNGTWSLESFPASSVLANNSNQTATNVIFYNSTSTQVGTTIPTLLGETTTPIPATAVSCKLTISSLHITLPVSDSVSSNIFESSNAVLTNNADMTQPVTINYTGLINNNPNTLMNDSPISLGYGQSIPIITGTETIYVFASGSQVDYEIISANVPYYINLIVNQGWSISTPSPEVFNLYNNGSNASSVVYYNTANASVTNPPTSISAGTTGPIAGTAVTASLTETIYDSITPTTTNMFVPVSGDTNSNIFDTGTITNNTTVPVTITYSGSLNSGMGSTLNTTKITISPNNKIFAITGTTSVTVFSAATPTTVLIPNTLINANTNYYINYSESENKWGLESFPASSILSNNSGYLATNVIFYDINNAQIGTTLASLPAGKGTPIPSTAIKCTFILLNATMTLAVSNTVNSNIAIPNIALYNNADTNITINYYSTINGAVGSLINSSPIAIGVGLSIPIITGALAISVYIPTSIPSVFNTAISTTVSSYINLIVGSGWSITDHAINYLLTNNNNSDTSSIIYYDTTSTLIGTSYPAILANNQGNIPGTAITAEFSTTINSTETNIWLPVYGGKSSNIFDKGTIINNSSTPIAVTYFGTLNPPFGPALNTTPITINSGQNIPVITGATSMTVVLASTPTTVLIPNTPIDAGTTYYITQSYGAWYISSKYPLSQLTNNSGNDATNVTFYNSNTTPTQVGQTILTLPTNGIASIPTSAVSCRLTTTLYGPSENITLAISDSISSNIFESSNVILNNNSDTDVLINYTGTVNGISTSLNSSPIPLSVGQSIPIITGTSTIYVYTSSSSSPVATQTLTVPNTSSYYINCIGNTVDGWSISTTPKTFNLKNNNNNNNNNSTASDVIFYDINDMNVGNLTSIAAGASGPIAGTAVTAYFSDTISDSVTSTVTSMYIPVYGGADSTIFSLGSITNTATTPVTVTYYGSLNSPFGPNLNTTQITINPNQYIPIITGTTSITVYSESVPVITTQPLTTNTSYFINYADSQWTINSFATAYVLINNFNEMTGTITFKDNSGNILTTNNALAPWDFAQIPTTGTTAIFTDMLNSVNTTLTIPVFGSTTSSNIFSNYVLTNNYILPIEVTYYGIINGTDMTQLNSLAIPLQVGQSMQIPLNTTHISATSIAESLIPTEILSTTSYIITNNSGAQAIALYTPMLVNNGLQNATNLNYYQSNGSAISPQYATFNVGSSNAVPIPGNATSASMTYATSTLTIATSFPATLNFFTANTITNNSEQSISINFYGPINDTANMLMNSSPLIILANNYMPIITGATFIEVIVGNQTVIPQTPLTPGTSYFINQNSNTIPEWTITTTIPLSNSYLYNNSTSPGSDLIFYTDINTPIGVPTSINPYGKVQIPLNALTAQLNELETNLTIPVSTSVDMTNIFTNFVITNETSQTISVTFYQVIDGTATPLNNPDFTAASNGSVAILTGSTAVTVKINGTTVIPLSQGNIVANSSYFVLYDEINYVYYLYASSSSLNVILVNNYIQDATDLTFYDSNNDPINPPGSVSFPNFSTVVIPSNAIRATLIDFNDITLDIPVQSNANSNVFSAQVIANNTEESVGIIFYSSLTSPLNTTPIDIATGASIPIITGALYVSVYNEFDVITNINQDPINLTSSYYITKDLNTWYLNQYTTSATLTNNYSLPATNLNFYSATDMDQVHPLLPTQNQLQPYSSTGIPSTATTASFTETFNSIPSVVTIPVSDIASSNIFTSSSIYNTTTSTIGITYYGTINGNPDTPLNTVPLSIAPINGTIQSTVPILTGAQYLIVTVDGAPVIPATNLPLIISYDVNFVAGTWYMTPRILTLTNNSNQPVHKITFYDNSKNIIETGSTISMHPWATIPIPTIATIAQAEFGPATITLPLSMEEPSKIFTNNLLINNSQDTVSVIFCGTVYGVPDQPLNDTPIVLIPGQSTPFITQALSMSILVDGQTISSTYPISSNGSYGINPAPSYSLSAQSTRYDVATPSVGPVPQPSSSTLGVIRFLGGQVQSPPSTLSVDIYGQNSNLFEEFLYINFYLQIITNNTARTATMNAINTVFNTYGNEYSMQPDFNYITNAYLINPMLVAAQQILIRQYPGSSTQITKFFILLQNRINTLAE